MNNTKRIVFYNISNILASLLICNKTIVKTVVLSRLPFVEMLYLYSDDNQYRYI